MSEIAPTPIAHAHETRLDAASLARLRALSRPGFSPRVFVRSIAPAEIGALIGLVLLVAAALLVYSFVILPDQVRFVQLSGQVSDNNAKIEALQGTITDPSPLMQQVSDVRTSLESFRTVTLKPRKAGRLAIVETVGRLTSETGARLSSAVNFDTRDPKAEALEKNVKRDAEKVEIRAYPYLVVTFGVAGTYDQLRRFISRLEASDQFVVIDSINLESDTSEELATSGRRAAPTSSGVVSLGITMTAYFQAEPPETGLR